MVLNWAWFFSVTSSCDCIKNTTLLMWWCTMIFPFENIISLDVRSIYGAQFTTVCSADA